MGSWWLVLQCYTLPAQICGYVCRLTTWVFRTIAQYCLILCVQQCICRSAGWVCTLHSFTSSHMSTNRDHHLNMCRWATWVSKNVAQCHLVLCVPVQLIGHPAGSQLLGICSGADYGPHSRQGHPGACVRAICMQGSCRNQHHDSISRIPVHDQRQSNGDVSLMHYAQLLHDRQECHSRHAGA